MSLSALSHALVHAFSAGFEAMRRAHLRMLVIRPQPGGIADNPPLSSRVMKEQLRAVYPSNDRRDGISMVAFRQLPIPSATLAAMRHTWHHRKGVFWQ